MKWRHGGGGWGGLKDWKLGSLWENRALKRMPCCNALMFYILYNTAVITSVVKLIVPSPVPTH